MDSHSIVKNALALNMYGSLLINLTSHYKACRRVTVDLLPSQRYSQKKKEEKKELCGEGGLP